MVQSIIMMVLIFVAILGFLLFSSIGKKRKKQKKIQEFKDRVYEYIYQYDTLNPFVIYNDIEASENFPREVLREVNAFDYIDREVKKAKKRKAEEKRGD